MKKKSVLINILVSIAYLILIGLLVYNVFELTDKYNQEEMDMIVEVEKSISEVIVKGDQEIAEELQALRKEYVFDIVVTRDDDVLYNSISFEVGESLLARTHKSAIAREAQGNFENPNGEVFVWYSIYRLNDSVFMNQFLGTLVFIVILITILIILSVYLIFKILFDPLKEIKKSIALAKDYDFEQIEEKDDAINKEFKTFVSDLETSIDAVSRQHTVLEKQLQAKREHLNNLVVVSRSMVHDLKTPIHQALIEREMAFEKEVSKEELIEMLDKHQSMSHEVMMDINRILKMLKNDSISKKNDPIRIDIIQTLLKAFNRFKAGITEKQLVLDFDAPESAMLETEESTFILLINNILSNMVQYAKDYSDIKINVDQTQTFTTLSFINEASDKNIERMEKTQNLFNVVQNTDEEYVYSSGNGLYLIKELSLMLGAQYKLNVEGSEVMIEVTFKHEEV